MVDRLHVTWYYNFERENSKRTFPDVRNREMFSTDGDVVEMEMTINDPTFEDIQVEPNENSKPMDDLYPSIMFDVATSMVLVNLPMPYSFVPRQLIGIKDNGDNATRMYGIPMDLYQMALFDTSTTSLHEKGEFRYEEKFSSFGPFYNEESYVERSTHKQSINSTFWAQLSDFNTIVHIDTLSGALLFQKNVSVLLGVSDAAITSDVMVARRKGETNDILVFGASILPSAKRGEGFADLRKSHNIAKDSTSFVLGVDGSQWRLLWMFQTPNDLPVRGQIAGVPLFTQMNDILAVFTGNETVSKIFTITSK